MFFPPSQAFLFLFVCSNNYNFGHATRESEWVRERERERENAYIIKKGNFYKGGFLYSDNYHMKQIKEWPDVTEVTDLTDMKDMKDVTDGRDRQHRHDTRMWQTYRRMLLMDHPAANQDSSSDTISISSRAVSISCRAILISGRAVSISAQGGLVFWQTNSQNYQQTIQTVTLRVY